MPKSSKYQKKTYTPKVMFKKSSRQKNDPKKAKYEAIMKITCPKCLNANYIRCTGLGENRIKCSQCEHIFQYHLIGPGGEKNFRSKTIGIAVMVNGIYHPKCGAVYPLEKGENRYSQTNKKCKHCQRRIVVQNN